jgi:hypothetical protein
MNRFASVLAAVAVAGCLSQVCLPPAARAESGDQADATQAVQTVYLQRQRACTPAMPPQFRSITWENFYPASGGKGRIVDANPHLGGPFQVYYTKPRVGPAVAFPGAVAVGQWDVVLEFC